MLSELIPVRCGVSVSRTRCQTHEKDEARREKYLGKKYCPASKAQENKLLYSKVP